MSNLRIVANNLAAGATLTASSAAGALVANNLRTDDKAALWRSAAGTWAQINAAWPSPVLVSCAAVVNCNLSPTAVMRVRTTNEQPVTNLWTNSNTLTTLNAPGLSKFDAVTTAPDGYFNAGLLRLDSANSVHYAERTFTGAYAISDTYTTSMFVKAAGVSVISLWHYYAAGSTGGLYAVFNLATGTVTSKTSQAATISAFPNGWFRITMTNVMGNAVAEPTRLLSRLILGGSAVNFTGDGVSGVYVYGQQFEQGPPSSYYFAGASAATRPLGYMDAWQSYEYNSGAVLCCPAPARKLRGWTPAQAASAYAYGGGATAVVWIPPIQAVGVSVIISDTANLQGYLEAATLVIGEYWSPQRNASYGASLSIEDTSKHYRTEAGGLGTDAGTRYRSLKFSLDCLDPTDRAALLDIVAANGMPYPMFVSLFPESGDAALTRDHAIYGKLSRTSAMMAARYRGYSTSIELEEV